jgi:hypothetical protein
MNQEGKLRVPAAHDRSRALSWPYRTIVGGSRDRLSCHTDTGGSSGIGAAAARRLPVKRERKELEETRYGSSRASAAVCDADYCPSGGCMHSCSDPGALCACAFARCSAW